MNNPFETLLDVINNPKKRFGENLKFNKIWDGQKGNSIVSAIEVVYYKTTIITLTPSTISFNAGGWKTVLTYRTINKILRLANAPFKLTSKTLRPKGVSKTYWNIENSFSICEFYNGITFSLETRRHIPTEARYDQNNYLTH